MPPDKASSGFVSPGAVEGPPANPVSKIGVFRKEGEYWTVSIGDNATRLKDSKGFGHLAHLLRHPAVEFHVLDLSRAIASESDEPESDRLALRRENLEEAGIHIGGLSDAGELLDDRAKSVYRRRLSELRQELEEAKALGKVERAEQLETEIDALTGELSRAVGLGGRNRRAASASERARQSITKAIKAVLRRIARSNAALGEVFARSIRTGTFCSYQPDPQLPIEWEFAGTNIEPPQPPLPSAKAAPAGPDYVEPSPGVLGFSPFPRTQRTPFVDREHESGLIRAAIEQARNGSGSLVTLAGGPGVGKTRLAIEMGEYAARYGFACSLGGCYERDEPFPYLPFVQAIEAMLAQEPSLDEFRRQFADNLPDLAQLVPRLRRVFPDIPEPLELPPAQRRLFLFQGVTEALGRAARKRPHLLILDDLQWADESTLALLTYLANRIAQLPLLIIGIYRDEYTEDNPALARTLEELIRQGVRPMKVVGLSKDSVARMLSELTHRQIPETLVSAIFEESNGNPFFVQEVYQHLIEEGKVFDIAGRFRCEIKIDEIDVPDNVRLIIARRLKHFSDSDKRALSAGAVIGRSFGFQLLAALSQMDIDELFAVLDRAQRMGMIVPSSEGPEKPFTFAHELVRQTLLAEISVARRQQLHAKVAAEIERLYPAVVNEYAGEIADHLLKAGSFADCEALVRFANSGGERFT